jgi:protein SCO1
MTTRAAAGPPPGLDREEGIALAGLAGLLVTTVAWWALALWPVQGGPEWLERTRYVCFGVADSGLPDAGGWIGLVAGPLGMLVILLAGWRRGVSQLLLRARSSAPTAAALGAMVLTVLLLLGGATVRVRTATAAPADAAEAGLPPDTYPRVDLPTPVMVLTGQDGSSVDLAEFRGVPVLVTFAFAHCSTICPVIVRQTLDAQAMLGEEGIRAVVLIVTLDPWRDTPSRLPAMASSWSLPAGDAWILSGPVAEVEAVLDGWNVPRTRDLTTGEVVHPSLAYVVDGAGTIAYAATGGARTLAELVRRVAE